MANSITSPSTSFGASYIPDLTESANIQDALKYLYFGSTGSANTSNGIYGALYTLYTGTPTLTGPVTVTGDIAVNGGDITSSASTFNIVTSSTAVTIGASTGTTSIGNSLRLATNSSSLIPVKFGLPGTPGTANLASTILDGSVEYDGNVFYATPKVNNTTAGRGLIQTPYVYVISSDTLTGSSQAISNGSGSGTTTDSDANPVFGKYIYLAASSTYFVEANIMVYHRTSRTYIGGSVFGGINLQFSVPSGATMSFDLSAIIDQTSSLATAPASAPIPYIYSSGTIDIKPSNTATNDTGYSMFRVKGILRTSTTAGNFGPTFNTNATATNDVDSINRMLVEGTVLANSFIKVTPLGGTTSAVNIGGWA